MRRVLDSPWNNISWSPDGERIGYVAVNGKQARIKTLSTGAEDSLLLSSDVGEVMNVPGVLGGSSDIISKIESASGRVIDGHAPGVSGKGLSAYIAAGIHSDHESVALAEDTATVSLTIESKRPRILIALPPSCPEILIEEFNLPTPCFLFSNLRD